MDGSSTFRNSRGQYRGGRNYQKPTGDLRDHLNKKRSENKNEPPPDPHYNFLADPLRDGKEYSLEERYKEFQERPPIDYHGRGRRRSGGNSSRSYNPRGRGFRGRTRSFNRGRGFNNWTPRNPSEIENGETEQDGKELTSNHENSDAKEDRPSSSNSSDQERNKHRNYEKQNYQNPQVPSSSIDQKQYQYRGRLGSRRNFNQRRPFVSRGRGYRRNLELVNITVQFNSATGEHKYTAEKVRSDEKSDKKEKEGEISELKIDQEGENWDEEENGNKKETKNVEKTSSNEKDKSD